MIASLTLGILCLGALATQTDWMLERKPAPVKLEFDKASKVLTLSNGIVARSWSIGTGVCGCISLRHLRTGEEFLRAVRPEAEVTIAGTKLGIGGLTGQPDQAFLDPAWLPDMKANPGFEFVRYKRTQRGVDLLFKGTGEHADVSASVSYSLDPGTPFFVKQTSLSTLGEQEVVIDNFKAEILATVEPESTVDHSSSWATPNMTVTTDYTFAGMALSASNRAVQWVADPTYTTQVNYELKTPCQLEASAPVGPAVPLPLTTFRVIELLHDSTDRERKSLQVRRMYRHLAPWVLDNPIMLHLTSSDPTVVRTAIDQAAECGFEMIVVSFWSGLDMEDVSPANLKKWKDLADYAHSKGLRFGGYSLLASRSVGPETDVIDPKTGKPGGAVFGSSPCLCSRWGAEYFDKLRTFFSATGFDLLEHDGSYPGDICASTEHPGHKGLADSQWRQYEVISGFYQWCREHHIFLNVPDNYFLAGSNKTGMGYRESNWSLPRSLQHIHARQNLYDGTWEKTPSMGWMMVPLVEYQGGGKEATIEPLKDHLADYEMHLANNFGFGAQACYRGPRIYDSPKTKAAVVKWVTWFKKHRKILEADVVHIRRADGRGLDAILHVDPSGETPAMLLVWNPTPNTISETLSVPLYFYGLTNRARFTDASGHASSVALDGAATARLKVSVPAKSVSWWTATRAD